MTGKSQRPRKVSGIEDIVTPTEISGRTAKQLRDEGRGTQYEWLYFGAADLLTQISKAPNVPVIPAPNVTLRAEWSCGCSLREEDTVRIVLEQCNNLAGCKVEGDLTDVQINEHQSGSVFELLLNRMRGY